MRLMHRLLLLVSILFGAMSVTSRAEAADFVILIDADGDPSSGCEATLAPGQSAPGIEYRLDTRVAEVAAPTSVDTVHFSSCAGAAFSAPLLIGGGQPLGIDNGLNAADVIELAVSQALIPAVAGRPATILFVAVRDGEVDLTISAPVELPPAASAIPGLGGWGVMLVALAVVALALRHPQLAGRVALVMFMVITSTGMLIAAGFVVDGQVGDWVGETPLVTDPESDTSTDGIDIRAGFGAREAGQMFFRIDVAQLGAPGIAVTDSTFGVPENSAAATPVGTVAYSNPGGGTDHSFEISAGNESGMFTIDSSSGEIRVAPSAALDHESSASYTLAVRVSDNLIPPRTGTGTITVNVTDVNEAPAPVAASFNVAEGAAVDTAVGTIPPADPDAGQTHGYVITAGNAGSAFKIDAASGAISVATPSALDLVANPVFSLTVEITDNGTPPLSGNATVTITLTDVNVAPTIDDATFGIDEHSIAGTEVGTVVANDADLPPQTLSFAITAGDDGDVFSIDNNGKLAIADAAGLDFETTPSFSLTVTVTDSGTPALSDTATVTVNLNDVNDAPVVQPATYSISENSGNGAAVGTVSASDADSPAQSLSYAISAGNTDGVFAIASSTGAITVADASKLDHETTPTYDLTVEATDNGSPARSGSATITIGIDDVNEAPAPSGGPFDVDEGSAVGTVVGTVNGNDPDAGQTLTFSITAGNDSGALSINAGSGVITVANTTALNAAAGGAIVLTVQASDDASPPLSATGSITVNVLEVNGAPSISDASFSVAENSAVSTVVGTVSASDPDAGQTLSFAILSGNTGGTFAIASDGTITVANAAALDHETVTSFSLSVQVTDDGVPALSDTAVVDIAITNVNEAPLAADASYTAHTNLGISVLPASGLLVGSSDPENDTVTVDSVGASTPAGALISANPDGSFNFTPPPGVTGEVSFDFTLCDDASTPACADGTATVTVAGPTVWFVDGGVTTDGNGTLTAPFKTLAGANTTADGDGDRVFVYSGTYSDGITLPNNARLIGQGMATPGGGSFDSVLGLGTIPTGTANRPTLDGITPVIGPVAITGTGTTVVRGVAIQSSSVTGLSASTTASLDIAETSVSATGAGAVNLSGTTGSVILSSTSSSGGTNNVRLNNVAGTVSLGTGTLSNASGTSFDVSGGTAGVSYAGDITNNAQRVVAVSSKTSGTVSLSGAISGTGSSQGIFLNSNTGATVAFSGPITLSTGANAAFTATGGGTVSATDTSSTLTTTTGTALNVANTSIGTGGLNFRSITSTSASANAGIVLQSTGTTAGLTVLGNSTAGSGGTISNKTGSCVTVSDSRALNLARMNLQSCGQHGLNASNLTGMTLTGLAISNNGNAADENGLHLQGLYGTVSVSGTSISGSATNNVFVSNSSGNLNMTVSGPNCRIEDNDATLGNDGILFSGDGTASMRIEVNNCVFDNNRGDHFQLTTSAVNSTQMIATFTNNILTGISGNAGAGVTLSSAGDADVIALVSNNDISGAHASAISLYQAANSTASAAMDVTIANNLVGDAGISGSGSATGDGINIVRNGQGIMTVNVENNTIRQYSNVAGVYLESGDGVGTMNATLSGNTITERNNAAYATNGVHLNAGQIGSDTGTVCLDLVSNSVTGSGKNSFANEEDIRLRQRFQTKVFLPGYAGGATDTAGVRDFVIANNVGTPTASVANSGDAGAGYFNTATCPQPVTP